MDLCDLEISLEVVSIIYYINIPVFSPHNTFFSKSDIIIMETLSHLEFQSSADSSNNLFQLCFNHCITDYREASLSEEETKCANTCVN